MQACADREVIAEARAEAVANANAEANATASASASATAGINISDTINHHGDSCHHHHHYGCGDCCHHSTDTIVRVDTIHDTIPEVRYDTIRDTINHYIEKWDTLWKTKYDTAFIDTGSYHVDTVTIEKWRDHYERPIPLDTLAKHLYIWEIGDVDTTKTGKRNVVHYEYVREWEYNNRVLATMNPLESAMDKNVLVHDIDVLDYRDKHLYYGKEVRRVVQNPVLLQNKDGSEVRTKDGIFLELYKNPDDNENCSIFDSELEKRYFLQTAGNTVKVYEYESGNRYVEKGTAGKGYLGDGSILLDNCIGNYSTQDHIVDFNCVSVDDQTLTDIYLKARDGEEKNDPKSAPRRQAAFIRARRNGKI